MWNSHHFKLGETIRMDAKKLEVIYIAIQLFSEKGYNATSVEEIAKESGMAKGSFYKLFHSKEDLLFEILQLIPQQIKNGLTKIYTRTYESSHDKLEDFIAICFENIMSNQTQLLMDIVFKHSLFKSIETEKKVQQMMIEFHSLIQEFLLEIYGHQIKPYIGDFISILMGLIFQYVHLFNCQKSVMDAAKLAKFITTLFDIIVNGILERKPEPVVNLAVAIFGSKHNPILKGQKIQALLKRMTITVKQLSIDNQEDYLNTLSLLEQQCTSDQPKVFLIKALVHYLTGISEIQSECVELTRLLEL